MSLNERETHRSDRLPIRVGDRIDDYEILAPLRSGGMASLFLGRRAGAAGFWRPVAIKVVQPHLADNDEFVRMFVEEACLCSQIAHPNVVHVESFGTTSGGQHYLAMEYVHGGSLAQLLRRLRESGRRLPPSIACSIVMKVAEGLHAAHELRDGSGDLIGVVHRDVSPQNILVSAQGHVKLIDFGVAKQGRQEEGRVRGKFRYMSPEQASGLQVDRRTDVYALGIVLWEALTGLVLFPGARASSLERVRFPSVTPPSRAGVEIPERLEACVMKALSYRPVDRFVSTDEFRRELARAMPDALFVGSADLGEYMQGQLGSELSETYSALPPPAQATISGWTATCEAISLGGAPTAGHGTATEVHSTDSFTRDSEAGSVGSDIRPILAVLAENSLSPPSPGLDEDQVTQAEVIAEPTVQRRVMKPGLRWGGLVWMLLSVALVLHQMALQGTFEPAVDALEQQTPSDAREAISEEHRAEPVDAPEAEASNEGPVHAESMTGETLQEDTDSSDPRSGVEEASARSSVARRGRQDVRRERARLRSAQPRSNARPNHPAALAQAPQRSERAETVDRIRGVPMLRSF